jgi:hypothetical protein
MVMMITHLLGEDCNGQWNTQLKQWDNRHRTLKTDEQNKNHLIRWGEQIHVFVLAVSKSTIHILFSSLLAWCTEEHCNAQEDLYTAKPQDLGAGAWLPEWRNYSCLHCASMLEWYNNTNKGETS